MEIGRLKQIIAKMPAKSGIYFFIEGKKETYIGKAVNLKNRLGNYINTKDTRIQKMVGQATAIRYKITDSEVEALITEALLIKKRHPLFNVLLKDDKRFSFVEFSRDKFPRIYITHQPKYEDSIGPFTDNTSIKLILKYLRRIFPYCTCKSRHHNYCLNYHIGNCPGFCCLKNPKIEPSESKLYRASIKAIRDLLSGKKQSVTKQLEAEMRGLADKHDFDKAIQIREKLARLNKIFVNAKVIADLNIEKEIIADTRDGLAQLKSVFKLKKVPTRIEGYDISNIQGASATGAMVVFKNGRASKSEYRKFKIKTVKSANDTAMLSEILTRRFRHIEWPVPDLILVDGGKPQLNTAGATAPAGIPILALTKNAKHRGDHIYTSTLKTAIKLSHLPEEARNLLLVIDSECHRFAINYHRKLLNKHMLNT